MTTATDHLVAEAIDDRQIREIVIGAFEESIELFRALVAGLGNDEAGRASTLASIGARSASRLCEETSLPSTDPFFEASIAIHRCRALFRAIAVLDDGSLSMDENVRGVIEELGRLGCEIADNAYDALADVQVKIVDRCAPHPLT